jgi:hypothetical protein
MSARVVVVPADESQPVEVRYIRPAFDDHPDSSWPGGYTVLNTRMIERSWPSADAPESVGRWMVWLDEDGKPKGLPINRRATRIGAILGWSGYPHDFMVGTALFIGENRNGSGYTDVPEIVETVAVEMGCEVHWYDLRGDEATRETAGRLDGIG